MKKTHSKISYLIFLSALAIGVASCGGGSDGDGDSDEEKLNAEFVERAESVQLSKVTLFAGRDPLASRAQDINAAQLKSGEVVTFKIDLETVGNIKDYALVLELIPKSIADKIGLTTGSGLLGALDRTPVGLDEESIIEFGGAFVGDIEAGETEVFITSKLPTLRGDQDFILLVTSSIDVLSVGEVVNDLDINKIPYLTFDSVLKVAALSKARVDKASTTVKLESDFTGLEEGGLFDKETGFSEEPLFQSVIELDLSSLKESEKISIELTWVDETTQQTYPLGIAKSTGAASSTISSEQFFEYSPNPNNPLYVPIAAYSTVTSATAMKKSATLLKDVADVDVSNAALQLKVFIVEGTDKTETDVVYDFDIPLVLSPNRKIEATPEEVEQFTPLSTLGGTICADAENFTIDLPQFGDKVTPLPCNASRSSMQWRFDPISKQIVTRFIDVDERKFCMTAKHRELVVQPLLARPAVLGFVVPTQSVAGNFVDISLAECAVESSSSFASGGSINAIPTQRFEMVGNAQDFKIKLLLNNKFLKLSTRNDGLETRFFEFTNEAESSDFSSTISLNTLDYNGRLLHLEKFENNGWGDASVARVMLDYGAESSLEYLPILGTTSKSRFQMKGALFGFSEFEIVKANAQYSKFLSKKTSVGNNYPIEISNGAEFTLDLFGARIVSKGEIKKKTITQSYQAVEDINDMLQGEFIIATGENEPETSELKAMNLTYEFGKTEPLFIFSFPVGPVPVTISAGIEGVFDFKGALDNNPTADRVGIKASLTQNFKLNAYVIADLDIGIAKTGVEGTLTFIEQEVSLSINGFLKAQVGTTNKLSFGYNISDKVSLGLIKGKVVLFAVVRLPFVSDPRYEHELWSTNEFLFSGQWDLFSTGDKNLVDIKI